MENGLQGWAFWPLFGCFLLSVCYVLSLYIWRSKEHCNHPATIKRRFLSTIIMMIISPFFVNYLLTNLGSNRYSIWDLLGLRYSGLVPAIFLPLILTMILFLGPLSMKCHKGFFEDEPGFCISDFHNLFWWRSYVVAPLSEEFVFRSCMLSLLIGSFYPQRAIMVSSLFFGLAHLHHMSRYVLDGMDVSRAVIVSGFQFVYTALFGAYSAFLFLRTGHFVSPFLAHVFCNFMGFPNFQEVLGYEEPRRTVVALLSVVGLVSWIYLLSPLTHPDLYKNELHWKIHLKS